MRTSLSRIALIFFGVTLLGAPQRGSAQIVTQPPASMLGTVGGTITITASAPAAASYQWQKSSDGGATYTPITGNASATTAALTLTPLQTTDSGSYQLVTPGGTSNAAVLKVLPGNSPVATNVAYRDSSQSGATAVSGAAATGTTSSVWNNLVGAAASTTLKSQALLTNAALVSDSGAATGMALTMVATSPTNTMSSVDHAWSDGSAFAPVSAIMNYYTYYWWNASLELTVTGLNPGAGYVLYGYGTGNTNNQGSSWTLDSSNGGATASALSDYGSGYTRDATNPNNLGHAYVKIAGVANASGTLIITVGHVTGQNDPYFNGFQLAPVPDTTITGQPADAMLVPGGSTAFTVTAPTATAFQWQFSSNNGASFTTIDPTVNSTAATATLQLTNTPSNAGGLYRALVTGATGAISYSRAATLTVVGSSTFAQTPPINVAFRDASQSSAPAVTGAAAIGSVSSIWNNLVGATASTTSQSQALVNGASLVSDSGAATGVTFTLVDTSPSYAISAVMHTGNDSTSYPPVTGIMTYYTYHWWSASLTLTFNGLKPGASYDLYGYGAGNSAGEGSMWTMSGANGGASASAMADFSSGYTRDVTNPNNLGHSYAKVTGVADSTGALTVVVNHATGQNDPYFSGFQLTPTPQTTITQQPSNTITTVGAGVTLSVVAPTGTSYVWQYSADGGNTYTNIDPNANPSAATANLTLTNVQSAAAGIYRVGVLGAQGVAVSNPATLTVAPSSGTTLPPAYNVAFRASTQSGAQAVAGAAAAGTASSVWNNLVGATPSTTLQSQALVSGAALVSDSGASTGATMTLVDASPSYAISSVLHTANDSTSYPPVSSIMQYYTYHWWGAALTITLNGLTPGTMYNLYGYGAGTANGGGGSQWTMDPSNGGATASALADFSSGYTRDVTNPNNLGHSYAMLSGTANSAGTLTFVVNHVTGQNDPYFSGFQLAPVALPAIITQPAANSIATLQGNFSLAVVASSASSLTYQWQKSTDGGSTFSNINPLTNSSATAAALSISSVQASDAGVYRVLVINGSGVVVSSNAVVTTSSTVTAPSISAQPANTTVVAGSSATFTVTASGSAPLTYQWQKSTDGGATYSNVGTGGNTLTLNSTSLSDAGLYQVVVSNSVGSATSNAASLTINQAPVISSQPIGGVIPTNQTSSTISVSVSGYPAPTFQWKRTVDGLNFTNVTGGTGSSLTVSNTNSGFYEVVITNSQGTSTSNLVYVGGPSTLLTNPVLSPAANATLANRDTPLSLTFASAPSLGAIGAVRVFDASNNSQVAVIDLSQINVFSLTANDVSYGTYHYATNVIQGDNYYTQPIVAVGSQPPPSNLPSAGAPQVNPNQVLIYLPSTTTLSYGHTYYVTIDPGVLVDSTGAAYAGISDTTTWRFTVKPSGPANGAAALTVGNDGNPSDFSTIQGAADFLSTYSPQPTVSSPVALNVRNGIYYEIVHLKTPYVTLQGQTRNGTVIAYLVNNGTISAPGAPAGTVSTRDVLRIDADNCTVQNLSIYNLTPNGGGQAEAYLPAGQHGVANHVSCYSYQDTMLVGGTFFMTDSYVEGAVDYIWGGGQAFFQRCELKANANAAYYSQSRNDQVQMGYAFVNCTLDAYPFVPAGSSYLSRTFNDFSQTIYINCKMGPHISPQGWLIFAGNPATLQLWEYMSTDLNGNLLDISQRPTFNRAFAVSGTSLVYTAGSTSNDVLNNQQVSPALAALFSTPAVFFGNWSPQVAPTIDVQPLSQVVNPGSAATFTVAATGVPDVTYQWNHNGTPISGATQASYTIPNAGGSNYGTYTVTITSTGSPPVTSNAVSLSFPNSWQNYVAAYGLDPSTTGALTAQPMGDGLSNLVKFAFGMSPLSSARPNISASGTTLLFHGLPLLTTNAAAANVGRFVQRSSYATDGLTYTPQFSSDLVHWQNSTATPYVVASDSAYLLMEVPIPAALGSSSSVFFRVLVTQSP